MALLTCSDVTFSYEGIPVLTTIKVKVYCLIIYMS